MAATLTLDRLRSSDLEKVNKCHFVKTFIDEQKQHAKSYAQEGRALFSSWDGSNSDKPNESTSLYPDLGFDTPVLKPRVAPCPVVEESSKSAAEHDSDKENRPPEPLDMPLERELSKDAKRKTGLTVSKRSVLQPISAQPGTKALNPCKKRQSEENKNDEHAASTYSFIFAAFF
jgi:hypothetical protein